MDNGHYDEEWFLIVGDGEWTLNKREAGILKDAIRQGNRGMVVFDTLVVNIPFIKEFFLKRRFLKPEYQVKPPMTENERQAEEYAKLTPEEKEEREKQRIAKWEEAKKKQALLLKETKAEAPPHKLTAKEFEARRKMLLEQAKEL